MKKNAKIHMHLITSLMELKAMKSIFLKKARYHDNLINDSKNWHDHIVYRNRYIARAREINRTMKYLTKTTNWLISIE